MWMLMLDPAREPPSAHPAIQEGSPQGHLGDTSATEGGRSLEWPLRAEHLGRGPSPRLSTRTSAVV